MKVYNKFFISTSLAIVLVTLLAGCATPANREAMTPANTSYGRKFDRSILLNVTGGQETDPMWTSEVSNREFAAALESAIVKSGIFSKIVRSHQGDYRLDVRLIELKQPVLGLDLTVTARTEWRIRRSMNDAPVWREFVTSDYTAKPGDSLYAVHRLRLANEGAIRENIVIGLAKIAKLNL